MPAAHKESAPLFSSLFPGPPSPSPDTPPPAAPPPNPPAVEAEAPPNITLQAESAPTATEPLAPEAEAPEPPQPWREELAERVESFRRRRANLKRRGDSSQNLDLDFEKAEDMEGPPPVDAKVLEFPQPDSPLDVELGTASRSESELPILEASPLEKDATGLRILSLAAVQAGETPLERGEEESEPVEILVGPTVPPAAQQVSPLMLPLAPLGRRFLAGLADALALLVGASLFALIFWKAGGHLRPDALNLAVLGFIAVFFILLYFGLFTTLTSSTPGLLWVGLEVRNFEGAYPTTKESFWRAFGYLVSISALMLGFLWALVDSEGLTWHDRMSGTFITLTTTR